MERRGGPAAVALVAGADVDEDVFIMDVEAEALQLVEAAAGADFGSGGDEQLGLRRGTACPNGLRSLIVHP